MVEVVSCFASLWVVFDGGSELFHWVAGGVGCGGAVWACCGGWWQWVVVVVGSGSRLWWLIEQSERMN